jgi:hypothetical protein
MRSRPSKRIGDQQRQVADLARAAHGPAVGVDVLAEQGDLPHSLFHQLGTLGQHIVERAADLGATGVGHHAEGAVLGAAFHDADVGGDPLGARRRQAVELLDLRKAHIHLRLARGAGAVQQLGQAVQGLRAEDDIHQRRAGGDGLSFLAGDAAADADHPCGVGLFPVLPAAEFGEDFLLRLLTHRAGVEQQQIGLVRILGPAVAVRGREHVGHLGRIVLVHLAPVGDEVKLPGHLQPSHAGPQIIAASPAAPA